MTEKDLVSEYQSATDLEELKHKNKMEQLEFEMKCEIDVEDFKHENRMEDQRIKNKSIERNIERKELMIKSQGGKTKWVT